MTTLCKCKLRNNKLINQLDCKVGKNPNYKIQFIIIKSILVLIHLNEFISNSKFIFLNFK